MTKRLSRYNTPETIKNNLPLLTGKKINIVTADGRVFYGILNKFDDDIVYFQNLRLKDQKMAINEIAEIIYDY